MIQIFTDLAANLPQSVVEKYGLRLLRLTYTVDGVESDPDAPFDAIPFYEAMRKGADVKTSMPSPGDARDAFVPLLEQGDDIICITLSGGISGTYGMLRMVAEDLSAEYPDRQIRIIDAKGASLGEGQHAIEAAELRDRDLPLIDVRRRFLLERQMPGLIAADGIHLTMPGYVILYDFLTGWLRQVIGGNP